MALNTRDFEYIRDLVRVRSAIVLDNDKDYLVELRLSCIVQQEGFASLQDFIIGELTAAPNVENVKTSLILRVAKYEPGIPIP